MIKQAIMKSSVTCQIGDQLGVDEAIVEAEVVEKDIAKIGAEVLDEKRHQQWYKLQAQNN